MMAPDAPSVVTLGGETDFAGFRRAARSLLAQGVDPDRARWRVQGDAAPELNDAGLLMSSAEAPALRVPSHVAELARYVVLHADRTRFALLYRLLWRLHHEPALRHDLLDVELIRARHMAQSVRREMHKMKAFVRFRTVERGAGRAPLHVAWFEPEHHVVEATAGFFVRRFAGMQWALLTPRVSVRWDGEALSVGPGGRAADAPPPDAGEALWLTYYEHIFNPARLKLATMRREMPRRYWPNLPEAVLIDNLAAHAGQRSAAMVEREAQAPRRRIPMTPLQPPPAVDGEMDVQRSAAARCCECPLGELATQTVWGEGPIDARLMLVGEQPGDQEDLHGRPFVGPAGQLLDRALADLGWQRSQLYVTNAVKHFKFEPRGKRRLHKTPAQKEADACQHWMEAEIAIVKPRAIVALGATAARQLLGPQVRVLRDRGQWFERLDGVPVLVTLHPSALLRGDPAQADAAYRAWIADLRQAHRTFDA
jgi:probable DNA metabolism protein